MFPPMPPPIPPAALPHAPLRTVHYAASSTAGPLAPSMPALSSSSSCGVGAATTTSAASSAVGPLASPRPGSLRRRLGNSSPEMARRCLEELPSTARELLHLLGDLDTVLEMVSAFGGGTWYIPTVWPLAGSRGGKASHPLRRVLTQEQMTGLTRYYGGTQLYIPRCHRALQRLRNTRIILSFSAGVAKGRSSRELVRRLALRHNLTDRRVWGILKMQAL